MFSLNTLEDFEKLFDTEEKSIEFLEKIRWGGKVLCPFCKSERVYAVKSKQQPYKCGNRECYKKFSVTVKSFIENSNLKKQYWLKIIFLYIKTKGRIPAISCGIEMNYMTAYAIDQKIKTLFEGINKENKNNYDLFIEAIENLFIYNPEWAFIAKATEIKKNHIQFPSTIDMNDPVIYKNVITLIKRYLHHAVNNNYITNIFCSPEDVLSTAYIFMAETDVKEITYDFLIAMIKKSIYTLFKEYLKEQPNIVKRKEEYSRRYKENGRNTLANWYIIQLVKSKFKNKWDLPDKTIINALVKEKRNNIIKRRSKNNFFYSK